MNDEATRIVRALSLQPHPEGGWYREVFRSPHSVLDAQGRTRSALTVIYFMLAGDQVSAWHKLRSDETWHFARGDELEICVLDETSGEIETLPLGPSGPYVVAIPALRPFAARLRSGSFALVTCCVAPGFDFADFDLLDARALAATHAGAATEILAFVR